MLVLCGVSRNMLGYVEKNQEAADVWAHQDSNLGPSDYESDALTN
jgi:hypothetical protein